MQYLIDALSLNLHKCAKVHYEVLNTLSMNKPASLSGSSRGTQGKTQLLKSASCTSAAFFCGNDLRRDWGTMPADRQGGWKMSRHKLSRADRALADDPNFKKGANKIRVQELSQLKLDLEMYLVPAIAFHNTVEYATEVKAQRGTLGKASEQQIARAGQHALQAMRRRSVPSNASFHVAPSRLDHVLEHHIPALFRGYKKHPTIQTELNRLRNLGANEHSIRCLQRDLAKVRFNPFRFGGANGKLDGQIACLKAAIPRVERFVKTTRKEGLPTIVGAGNPNTNTDAASVIVPIGVILVIAGILVFIILAA
jgi:hypothetical protein